MITRKKLKRIITVGNLHEVDNLSYKQIGLLIGISTGRVGQLYKELLRHRARKTTPFDDPSTKLCNWLLNAGFKTKEEVDASYLSKRIHPFNRKCRNFGMESFKELSKWLGRDCSPTRQPYFTLD